MYVCMYVCISVKENGTYHASLSINFYKKNTNTNTNTSTNNSYFYNLYIYIIFVKFRLSN